MGSKVKKIGIKRQAGYLYFIDRHGDVSRTKMTKMTSSRRPVAEKVAKTSIQRRKGYLYYLDQEGDISKAQMTRNKGAHKRILSYKGKRKNKKNKFARSNLDFIASFYDKKKIEFLEKFTVFLSYSHKDKKQVQEINNYLKKKGISTWFDNDKLKGGDVWEKKIKKAIENCYLFVSFLSHNSVNERGYFQSEAKFSLDVWKKLPEGRPFIIPVELDKDVIIPESLKKFHIIKYTTKIKIKKELSETIKYHLEKALNH